MRSVGAHFVFWTEINFLRSAYYVKTTICQFSRGWYFF